MLYSYHSSDTLKDMATLHSCALACRAWRIRSQKMLFYKVQLSDSPSFHKLVAILDTARHLYDYVHEVQLTGYHLHTTTSIFALFPAIFSRKLPNLERICVVHLLESSTTWYPRTSDPPKFKSLPYIPLHPHFPIFLSSFTAVSSLYLEYTTFSSFTELGRITSGASHVHVSATGMVVPPSFAPKLRDLRLLNMVKDGVERLIWTRGPHLTWLDMTIPLSFDINGEENEILASWKTQNPEPILGLRSFYELHTTRRGFADALRDLGTIIEAMLRALQQPSPDDDPQNVPTIPYRLCVVIFDWEDKREWWSNHLDSCFPSWAQQQQQLSMDFRTPPYHHFEWAIEEEASQSSLPVFRASRARDGGFTYSPFGSKLHPRTLRRSLGPYPYRGLRHRHTAEYFNKAIQIHLTDM
ncbi:hypothetical protein V8D89_001283 [Ganoderma adspersum]